MIDFLIYLLTIIGIWSLLALSLNVQFGLTGLINLGHIVFFMVGGYASSILVMFAGWPMALGWVAAMVIAAFVGVLMTLPTATLRQDYWAISSLAFAEIIRFVFKNTPIQGDYIGASFGIPDIPQPLGAALTTDQFYLFFLALTLVILGATFAVVEWVSRSPYGRVLKAIREDDHVALALGKNVRSIRMRAMALGGAIGGLAGAMFAHYNAFIQPNYFLPLETFLVWAMLLLGGKGNHVGAIVGAVVIQLLYNSTRFLKDLVDIDQGLLSSGRMIVIGVLIILVVLYMPNGLVPEKRRRYARQ
jgi:branched-chain amino acid transport system permease protein